MTDAMIETLRDGLIAHIEGARPEELIRIAQFIEDDPAEMRRGLIRALQREAARRRDGDTARQNPTEK